jgi:inorganic pyrophosphatase
VAAATSSHTDPRSGRSKLGKQLPAGAVFPFDFGFVPSTLADDKDPLDILVLLETATFPGCVVHARLIGAINGTQREDNRAREANPRLIGVAEESIEYGSLRELRDLPPGLVSEIEHFFVSYNAATGRTYEPTGRLGPKRAGEMIKAAERRLVSAETSEPD